MGDRIFVTGGAGYIGSHTVLELLESGYEVRVYDNLSNASSEVLKRVEELTGRKLEFVRGDIRDRERLERALEGVETVIHFAGLKAVGTSVEEPLVYYDNNVVGSVTLLRAMESRGVRKILFSSSATVYGDPVYLPLDEAHPVRPVNPYGRTKRMIEEILEDLCDSDPEWSAVILRYFNPVGAHPSGRIGEDPRGTPDNLMPYLSQVAVGRMPELRIFGDDYETSDGTGVRDYIHVVDLARGHLAALKLLKQPGCETVNLGTGRGYSVLELLRTFEEVSGVPIPCRTVSRRSGDVAACYADPSRAEEMLGWRAERDLTAMCRDTWNWQRRNPRGYEESDRSVEENSDKGAA